MTPAGQLFLGLTAIVTVLVAVLTFAVLKFFTAARDTRVRMKDGGMETALLSAALQDAVTKLKAQERAMALRAEASERLSDEIIANLTAGLLMVNRSGEVQIVNPVGRRLLNLHEGPHRGVHYRQLLAHAEPLAAIIEQCLSTGRTMIRRAVELPAAAAPSLHLGLSVSPLGDDSSAPHGVICLFTDLSAVVALEEQVRLKDSLARVGELTAGIAHEFRNGLATIHGYSRLLNLDALPEQFRPYVEGIRAETESMREVVTNFLNFAQTGSADAVAGRSRRHRRARGRRPARRCTRAGRRHPRRRRVRDDRRRRRAAPAGVQQPAAECHRGLCRGVHRAVRFRGSADRPRAGRVHGVGPRQRPGVSRTHARSRVSPVLHDESAGHGPRPGARAEDCRHAQWARVGR